MNSAIGLGNILAFIVSYRKWHSLFGPSSTGCLDGAIYSIMGYFIGDNNK